MNNRRKPMSNDTDTEAVPLKADDDHTMSKPSKALMKTWGMVTRFTLILYLCASAVVYMAFSRDQMDHCVGFGCDHSLSTDSSGGTSVESQTASKDSDAPALMHKTRPLPSFVDGGVIFFLHVPKTGGISIRKALSQGNGKYMLSDDRQRFDKIKREMSSYVKYGTDGEVVVMELHAATSPTIMETAERIHQWRNIASRSNVPFYAFTVLRDPLSLSTSWFNFFHGMDHGDENYVYYETPTEQDFLDTAVFNPQCGFLVKGDVVFTEKKEQQLIRASDCDNAYDTLLEEMDWVGITSAINNETFPILRSLVGSNTNADHLVGAEVKNKSPPKISKANLSPKAVQQIRKMTLWDQKLYEKAKRDFSFEQIVMVEEQTAVKHAGRAPEEV